MGDSEAPTLFILLPLELRTMIYNLVYAPTEPVWIFLSSEYDCDERQDVLRRRSSRELLGAISFNRTCRLIHFETQRRLASLLNRVKFTISLLTYADDHIYTSFCESYIGELTPGKPTSEFRDSPLSHYIPLPPHNITFLRLCFKMYGEHWSHLRKLEMMFPSLKYLHINIRAPCVPDNRYTSLQQDLHGYRSARDFYKQTTILDLFLRDLSIYAAVSGCLRDHAGEHIGCFWIKTAHLKHVDATTDEWELEYTYMTSRSDKRPLSRNKRKWRLKSVAGDRGSERISWKYAR